jgi:hypothetical protein
MYIWGNNAAWHGFTNVARDGTPNGGPEGPCTHALYRRCARVIDVSTGQVVGALDRCGHCGDPVPTA